MDLLSQHEAFLRAIFDAPDDDTPRLVYADFLQENGEEERAQLIRWQCGRGEKPATETPPPPKSWRGFPPPLAELALTLEQLSDADALRRDAVRVPELFGLTAVSLFGGRITSPEPFDVLFGLAAFARVTELGLAGTERNFPTDLGDPESAGVLIEFILEPVITTAGVEALARHRGARRLTALDLRNNNLDNDAARALAQSPYLGNLKRLRLLEGNRLRGKVWQQVIERFGEDVVG